MVSMQPQLKRAASPLRDPGNNVYDLVSAGLYEKAGRNQDAIALLEKSAAARPSDEEVTAALAGLYNRSGSPLKAAAVLVARLKADPESIAIGTALARLYLTTGRAQDAKKLFAEFLSRRPTDVGVLHGLAEVAAVAERNWSEAKDYIDRARIAGPSDPAPGIALVNLALLRQDWTNAMTVAGRIAEQFPTNTNVLDAKGRAQIAAGDTEGAVATYKRIYELSPDSFSAMANYVALLKGAKEFGKARTVLEAALAHDPKNSRVNGDLIRVDAGIDGMQAGLTRARAFAVEDPENPFYDIVSAEFYEKAGRRDEAVDLLEKAVAAWPSTDAVIGALSGLYARTGDPGKAVAVLNTRLQTDPKDSKVRFALASLYLKQKKYDEATAEYNRVVAERPGDAEALNNLAWLYQQKGDLAKARELAEQAVAAAPTAPQIADTLGWVLLTQGEADRALAYLSAASLSAPKEPNIKYHLAVTLDRLGRAVEARAMLETLLGSDVTFSDRAEAEKLLQQLKRG
jgi:putative PEP-CTERM system TPR-repeat lipoprotein